MLDERHDQGTLGPLCDFYGTNPLPPTHLQMLLEALRTRYDGPAADGPEDGGAALWVADWLESICDCRVSDERPNPVHHLIASVADTGPTGLSLSGRWLGPSGRDGDGAGE